MASPIVVMGVSGSGKSTVGAALAQRLRVPFADADDFHPPANIAKMTRRPSAQRRRPVSVARSDRGVAGRAVRRRGSDELLGAQAQVPRPAAPPLPGRRVPAPQRHARGHRQAAGQPAGTLHARVTAGLSVRHPRTARAPTNAASSSTSTRTSTPSSTTTCIRHPRRAQPNRRTDDPGNHHPGGRHRAGRTRRSRLAAGAGRAGRASR